MAAGLTTLLVTLKRNKGYKEIVGARGYADGLSVLGKEKGGNFLITSKVGLITEAEYLKPAQKRTSDSLSVGMSQIYFPSQPQPHPSQRDVMKWRTLQPHLQTVAA